MLEIERYGPSAQSPAIDLEKCANRASGGRRPKPACSRPAYRSSLFWWPVELGDKLCDFVSEFMHATDLSLYFVR